MNELLKVLPSTPKEFNELKSELEELLSEGEINVIETKIRFDQLAKIVKSAYENQFVKAEYEQELSLQDKEFVSGDYVVQKTQRKTYDFSGCNDSEWEQLDVSLSNTKKSLKGRENFLKTLHDTVVNPETGECIYPAATKTSDFIKVTPIKRK